MSRHSLCQIRAYDKPYTCGFCGLRIRKDSWEVYVYVTIPDSLSPHPPVAAKHRELAPIFERK